MTPQTTFPTTTLILTSYYTPHRVASWQDVVTEFFTGKVEILAQYDEVIYKNPETNMVMLMPAVARLLRTTSAFKKGVKFSRVNVMSRDEFKCQYCGNKFRMNELNYDHVIPRAQGGKTIWTNIATSCWDCNSKKGARTPEQAKMKLIRQPYRPKTLPLSQPIFSLRKIPKEWEPYLGSAVA